MHKPGSQPTIAVLGASGLIGEALACLLHETGFPTVAIARRFNAAQKAAFNGRWIESPIVGTDASAPGSIIERVGADIVVNCIGMLQQRPFRRGAGDDIETVHLDFVRQILDALNARSDPVLLVHMSIPGGDEDDHTPFARTKRAAERLIGQSSSPFAILRPGFVVAPSAYGGSALVRALAQLPFSLPVGEAERPFAAVDVHDIAQTVAVVAERWRAGERDWCATWDVMADESTKLGHVVDAFRARFGGLILPRKSGRGQAAMSSMSAGDR